jgi:hypothetical protein
MLPAMATDAAAADGQSKGRLPETSWKRVTASDQTSDW